jgi:hypothetical protein
VAGKASLILSGVGKLKWMGDVMATSSTSLTQKVRKGEGRRQSVQSALKHCLDASSQQEDLRLHMACALKRTVHYVPGFFLVTLGDLTRTLYDGSQS